MAVVNRFLSRATGPRPPTPTARTRRARALARVGYGDGDHVAEGRLGGGARAAAQGERGPAGARTVAPRSDGPRSVGGRESSSRARSWRCEPAPTSTPGAPREAALQARVALEAALAEL